MATNNPNHAVIGHYGHRYKAGDEVIINKPSHPAHDKQGEIYSVRNYDDRPRIGVHILESDGGGGLFSPEELILN